MMSLHDHEVSAILCSLVKHEHKNVVTWSHGYVTYIQIRCWSDCFDIVCVDITCNMELIEKFQEKRYVFKVLTKVSSDTVELVVEEMV